ncbi:MAG TPA: hypothetical protein VNP95_00690 [Thermomicrobiales bacterium]|nr:hypothetical protein [Thermomicrobiales bacterium]
MSDETGARTPDEGESSPATSDPVIPDGGLADAMPDWLRRPPAWRGMPVPEPSPAPAPEPAGANDPVAEATPDEMQVAGADGATRMPKELPPPDTSPIDPSTLIDLGDLPEWLVGLGKRDLSRPSHPDVVPEPDAVGIAIATETAPVRTASVPLPPFLRDGDATDAAPTTQGAIPETPAFAGMSRRFLVMAGALVVVILVAILLAYLG